MYAKYQYNPGSSYSNLLGDIRAILTGTTDKASLSANCDQANTYITATEAAGWSVVAGGGYTNFTDGALPASAVWADVAWNGTVFCAVANGTAAATSPDGAAWTARTLPIAANWDRIIWNGTVFCAISSDRTSASSIAATSPDGITWTQQALSSAQFWGALAWGGASPLFVALPRFAPAAVASTSPDGAAWSQRTLPVSAAWAGVAWNGSVFCAVAGVTAASFIALTSPDGITWTQRTLPVSAIYSDIAWNGTVFCAIAGGEAGLSSVVITSPDGITWTQQAMPDNLAWRRIVWNGATFIATACQYGVANTAFAFSVDGASWTLRNLPSAGNWRGVAWGANKWCLLGTLTGPAASSLVTVGTATLGSSLRALNADGTTYKYVNMDLSAANKLVLRVFESLSGEVSLNPAYQSDSPGRAQQLDIANGGVLYIGATARYILMLSYKPAGTAYGSSGYGSFSGICEHSRDDQWNTAYPPYAFISSENLATCQVPRIKSGVATDAVGAAAALALQPNYSMAKQVLNATGTAPINSCVDMRLSNTASWTYTVLGGILLGALKQTTNSAGVTADETVVNSQTYVVWSGGTSNPALRLLIPKF